MLISEKDRRESADWESWLTSGVLIPVFQPILSSESTGVFGYEVLGRLKTESGLTSLGPFFLAIDEARGSKVDFYKTSDLFRIKKKVDREIRYQALKKFKEEAPPETKLFINVSPHLMFDSLHNFPSKLPYTIRVVRELGIDPTRIVIEITEERFEHNLEVLKPILNLYRSEGFSIAVDDAGSEASNLDRIGLYHPEIIKVDLQMLRRSTFSRNFKEILLNLSRLGESLGSSLLFEGIESNDELYNSLNYGARYIQGYYFAKPDTEFAKKFGFRKAMSGALEYFHSRKNEEMEREINWEIRWKEKLSKVTLGFDNHDGVWEWDSKDLSEISKDKDFFRMYITNPFGFQLSPNYFRDGKKGLSADYSFLGKNWSWRPYFFEHIHKSRTSLDSWAISPIYHDISENVMLRTFSRDFGDNLILFIDIILSK
ncbi:EAL domain-containing protein [Leptospira ognonensis]|uniref:EAL domain-containing protein n=1 Tax=Leptospira ognonensis TaxID=2484945 RepID=A0A4R9JV73_9LEPT|nr:EAL domain-containing protein [Leptospira ognonensis]TGL55883.1 EAL domain-containing protein [Leptospira ognonensis]